MAEQWDGTFTEVATEAGVANHVSLGWGTGFFDYDNDGDLDLYVANGTVYQTFLGNKEDYDRQMQDRIFENLGNGRFGFVQTIDDAESNDPKEGLGFGDYDNDGFLDVFAAGSWRFPNVKNSFYKNAGNDNNWLKLKLRGTKSNRDGVGARITVISNAKVQIAQVQSGDSFLSQNSPWPTFGLEKATAVEKLEVLWPSGISTTLENINANQTVTITEDD